MASLLNIERRWSDGEEGGYILRAEYYSARLLDTDTPQYETQKELLVEKTGGDSVGRLFRRTMVGTAVFRGVRRRVSCGADRAEHPAPPAL